jgi:hypothetical protein
MVSIWRLRASRGSGLWSGRHCEPRRGEAIQREGASALDCFGVSRLAMTAVAEGLTLVPCERDGEWVLRWGWRVCRGSGLGDE